MSDKFFALYWFLCVSISIIRFIKWSEMDPNVKPQISVDTFDHDNPQFYPGVYVALIKLLIYPVSTCTTEH